LNKFQFSDAIVSATCSSKVFIVAASQQNQLCKDLKKRNFSFPLVRVGTIKSAVSMGAVPIQRSLWLADDLKYLNFFVSFYHAIAKLKSLFDTQKFNSLLSWVTL